MVAVVEADLQLSRKSKKGESHKQGSTRIREEAQIWTNQGGPQLTTTSACHDHAINLANELRRWTATSKAPTKKKTHLTDLTWQWILYKK